MKNVVLREMTNDIESIINKLVKICVLCNEMTDEEVLTLMTIII